MSDIKWIKITVDMLMMRKSGLLSPDRSPKNRRKYSMEDIERGKLIQFLTREIGVNLAGVKLCLNLMEKLAPDFNSAELKDCLNDLVQEIDITPEIQQENRAKLSKRGRKKTACLV